MERAGKTLLVEDSEFIRKFIGDVLRKRGHIVLEVESGEAAWDAYREEQFSLVVVDWMLPGMSGIELVENIRMREKSRYTSILMLTSRDTLEDQERALSAGADDYLTKPVTQKVLNLRLGVVENNLRLRIERSLAEDTRREAQEELKRRTTIDALTGVSCRRYLVELGNREITRARRYHRPLSVLQLAVDGFRAINRDCSSAVGDEVLRLVASITKRCLRECDLVGRLAGRNFMAILPETGLAEAAVAAERLRSAVEVEGMMGKDTPVPFTVRVGVAELFNEDMKFDSLMERVERMAQQAKQKGGNCIAWVADDPD
ncbi:MAG: GGDEF domain-containing response regulator [Planctomycetota bacterium]|jgi:diguanylate cyclase (GGDEF)-like protein